MTVRTPMIAGNWKMYKTCEEAQQAAAALVELTSDVSAVEVMIAPPFTDLVPVAGGCAPDERSATPAPVTAELVAALEEALA